MSSGVGSLAYFSEEESGESSNQEDESDAGESEEHDADDIGLVDEQLERRSNTGGGGAQSQRTLQAPQTMQWAVRQRESNTPRVQTTSTTGTTPGGTDIVLANRASGHHLDTQTLKITPQDSRILKLIIYHKLYI